MVKLNNTLLLTALFLGALVVAPTIAIASGSANLFERNGHVYDDWGVFRTRANGVDGFLGITSTSFDPIIAYESLGDNANIAWQLGEQFAQRYPDDNQRAQKIFHFVRDRIRYTSDSDQFGTDEFAQNADEVAEVINAKQRARGDCEDSAVLLAVMYKAAGFRSAMVVMPGHVATLVHLPNYRKVSRKLTLDGEAGWVWAEATGVTNALGWVPEAVMGEAMSAREITANRLTAQDHSVAEVSLKGGTPSRRYGASPNTGTVGFLGSVGLLWMVGGRRGGPRRRRR